MPADLFERSRPDGVGQLRLATEERLGWPHETPGMDEVQASAGARSEALPLLHPCKGSGNGLTAHLHGEATQAFVDIPR
jgi:hypothetical protein